MINITNNHKIIFSGKGFSTVEILVALFIFSLISSSVIVLSFGSQDILANLKTFESLLSQSQSMQEVAKAKAFYDFSGVVSEEDTVGGMEIFLDVSFVYDSTKKIKSRVSMPTSRFREVELYSYVSSWRDSLGSNTCFARFENIENYSILSELVLSQSYSASDIDIVRDRAYITLEASSTPNFLVVDVLDLDNPQFVSNDFSTGRKLNALHVAGKNAFVATNSTEEQLQVIDIFDTQKISFTEYRLPDQSSTTTAASIFYKNKKIYLGTKKHNGGQEFHIIDVSNLSSPGLLGSWEADTKVNDIVAQGDIAFIATPNPTPLRMLDISGQDILLLDDYETGGNSNHGGQAVALTSNFLALGRSISGISQPDYHELYLFDISQNDLDFKASKKVGASVRDLIIRENFLALIATLGSLDVVQFRSLAQDNLLGMIHEIDLPGKPVALDCEESTIFVVTESPNASLIVIGKNENN